MPTVKKSLKSPQKASKSIAQKTYDIRELSKAAHKRLRMPTTEAFMYILGFWLKG